MPYPSYDNNNPSITEQRDKPIFFEKGFTKKSE